MGLQKTTVRVPCKECGSECHTADFDENGSPVWECNNCGTVTQRQIRVSKKQRELTKWLGV